MNIKQLEIIRERLASLSVFRCILENRTVSELCLYLDAVCNGATKGECISRYCSFAAELYNEKEGDFTRLLSDLCCESDNICVKIMGRDEKIPDFMRACMENELEFLTELSDITPDELTEVLGCDFPLPCFASGGGELASSFRNRAENISKYGYGIYAVSHMFYLDDKCRVTPVRHPDKTRLADLAGYEREKKLLCDNTWALLDGMPAANALLSGDAGTGKSSTVKAIVNELYTEGLRIIEIKRDQLRFIPALLDELAENPLKFILFIDDLSFTRDDGNYSALKAVLEGSVSAKSENVVIYATSNRRHLVKESFSDRDGDDVHRNETMQELLSLSERFGLRITFSKPDKETYLKIVASLAEKNGIEVSEKILGDAERFALESGSRSARAAKQFTDMLTAKKQS